ncbi:hypothetical protein GJ496_004233 [Pomphorhynchus laevis]|nr:hypothetical protein GJ496_004233 [Pomphorhynchus laevis]
MSKSNDSRYTFVVPSNLHTFVACFADYATSLYFLTVYEHSQVRVIIDDQSIHMSPFGSPLLIHLYSGNNQSIENKQTVICDALTLMTDYHQQFFQINQLNEGESTEEEAFRKIHFHYVYHETKKLSQLLTNPSNVLQSSSSDLIKDEMSRFLKDVEYIWNKYFTNIVLSDLKLQNRYVVRLAAIIFGLLHALCSNKYAISACLQSIYDQLFALIHENKRNKLLIDVE